MHFEFKLGTLRASELVKTLHNQPFWANHAWYWYSNSVAICASVVRCVDHDMITMDPFGKYAQSQRKQKARPLLT